MKPKKPKGQSTAAGRKGLRYEKPDQGRESPIVRAVDEFFEDFGVGGGAGEVKALAVGEAVNGIEHALAGLEIGVAAEALAQEAAQQSLGGSDQARGAAAGRIAVKQHGEQRVGAQLGFIRVGSFNRRGLAEKEVEPLELPGSLGKKDAVLPPERVGDEMQQLSLFGILRPEITRHEAMDGLVVARIFAQRRQWAAQPAGEEDRRYD